MIGYHFHASTSVDHARRKPVHAVAAFQVVGYLHISLVHTVEGNEFSIILSSIGGCASGTKSPSCSWGA
eukprot:IDg9506t1